MEWQKLICGGFEEERAWFGGRFSACEAIEHPTGGVLMRDRFHAPVVLIRDRFLDTIERLSLKFDDFGLGSEVLLVRKERVVAEGRGVLDFLKLRAFRGINDRENRDKRHETGEREEDFGGRFHERSILSQKLDDVRAL